MSKKKLVVLLSGGLDSTVNLYTAHHQEEVALAITFDYGQRASESEIRVSRKLCEKLNIPHQVVTLPFFKEFGQSSLTDHTRQVPVGNDVQIDSGEVSAKTAKAVWVPNRNGIFLNVAAGYAEMLGAQAIVPGFNKEEAQTFPDNSIEFIEALNQSLSFSTANGVEVLCYTANMTKPEIVKRGLELGVNWALMWPCYFNHSKWCGVCESCRRAKRAMQAGGVPVQEYFEVV